MIKMLNRWKYRHKLDVITHFFPTKKNPSDITANHSLAYYSFEKKMLSRQFSGFLTPSITRCPCTVDYNSSCDTGQCGFPAALAAAL